MASHAPLCADAPLAFAQFREGLPELSDRRAAIVAAYRRPEADCLLPLLDLAELPREAASRAAATARRLVEGLRTTTRRGGVEELIREYDLSSHEGVALMCLAEALLRIPDAATRDALIRDKLAHGDLGAPMSATARRLFVNAATWGLRRHRQALPSPSVNETGARRQPSPGCSPAAASR